MTMQAGIPRVVLVGRTNVGKSTLFNRLSLDVKSIAYDYHGVTRDFLKDVIEWQGRFFEIFDTGGIALKPLIDDDVAERARVKALALIDEADLVLFVCDGKAGLTTEDRGLSKMLHKSGKKVILVVNKIDAHIAQEQEYEFDRLGHKPVYTISAQHGRGIADLLEAIVAHLPLTVKVREEEPSVKIALIGKPNVGKSSLLNLLVGHERALVSPVAGTTREAIAERVTFYQEDILITDTPGVRRKRAVEDPLEKMMVKSTLQAVDDADIILLLIDASAGTLVDQELKLAFYAFEQKNKSVILLFNKMDIQDPFAKGDLAHNLEEYKYFVKKVEMLSISCLNGRNIGKIMPLVAEVWGRAQQRFNDEELSRWFKEELEAKPLYHSSELLELYKVQQVAVSPLALVFKVNKPEWFGPSQLKFFEGLMRNKFDLKSVPLRFFCRHTLDKKDKKSTPKKIN
jgi:GTP-binding protein